MDPCNGTPYPALVRARAPLGWVLPITLSVLAGACGGGGSGPTTPPAPPPAPPPPTPATIDIPAGRVALGLVSAGEVRFLAIAADGEESELALSETGDDGRFAEREVETDHTGPLRIGVAPNDEETSRYICDLLDGCMDRDGARADFGETLPLTATLSAAVSSASESSGTINITPFTTAAVERAIELGGLTSTNIDQADQEMAEALEALLSQILQREVDLEDDPKAISIVDLTDEPGRIAADHTGIEFLVAVLHASLLAMVDDQAEDDVVERLAAAFAESGTLPANDTVAGAETIDVADLLRVAAGELEAVLSDGERRDHVRQLLDLDDAASGDQMIDRMQDLVVTYEGVTDTVELAQVDSDGDGLANLDEIEDGLDPQNPDSDGDTVADGRDPFPLDGRRTVEPDVFPPARDFAALCANPRSGDFPDRQGTFVDENNWLRSWSNDLYLWYDEITDVDPVLHSTPRYFDLMRTFATTLSGRDRDRFHFTLSTEQWDRLSQSGVSGGYGIAFAILARRPPRDVRVAYIEPNSPASRANIGRGARILTVDGSDVTYGSAAVLNAAFYPSRIGETHEFEVQDLGADASRTISLTSALITSDPVQNNNVIETGTGSVGYMSFNDHIATAERELVDAMTEFEQAGVDDLVLDLRYNGGGYVAIASQVAYMIAGPSSAGQTFDELRFNDKHRTFNPVTGRALAPIPFYDSTVGLSIPSGRALPSLNLSRVIVLTGGGTCSASESIINGLRGIDVEVIQIGTTTCGKPYGFYPADNCGTTYFSIQFQGVNAKGFGDYPDGFSPQNTARTEGVSIPGCVIGDDFGHALGDVDEARLKSALQYLIDETCPAPAALRSARPSAGTGLPTPVDAIVPKSIWLQNRW
ncbi:MAG: S41 family peptidase [Gammaproteobacteria bacterium]|nr:S41 family peptidase [Gammaproteobacteria bacterium]